MRKTSQSPGSEGGCSFLESQEVPCLHCLGGKETLPPPHPSTPNPPTPSPPLGTRTGTLSESSARGEGVRQLSQITEAFDPCPQQRGEGTFTEDRLETLLSGEKLRKELGVHYNKGGFFQVKHTGTHLHPHTLPPKKSEPERGRGEGGRGPFINRAQLNLKSTNTHMNRLAYRPLRVSGR